MSIKTVDVVGRSSHARRPKRVHIERLLDEALEETFPASDSIAVFVESASRNPPGADEPATPDIKLPH